MDHYRVGLSVFLVFATIYALAKYKRANTWYIGLYLIILRTYRPVSVAFTSQLFN